MSQEIDAFGFEPEADATPGEADTQPDIGAKLAEMTARYEKLEADNLALRRQMTAAAFAAPTAPAAPPPPPPALDLKGLPDPMDDRGQWEGAAAQRINQYLNQRLELERQAQAAPAANPADHLWNEFKMAHPDIAADEERVGVAVHFAKEKAKRRGLDVDRYMAGATDMFFEDVVAEHERLFGKAAPVQKKTAEENRTAGLFGGMEGMGKPTQAKSQETLGSISGDILKMQRSAGLTW